MGLIDTSKTEKLNHPYEKGEWVEVRPLLATELDGAKDAKIKRTMNLWGDSLDTFKDMKPSKEEEDEDTLAKRVAEYDPLTLLKHAVVAWSYDAPVELESVERLDAVTRDWLIDQIVSRNTRPLGEAKSSDESSKWVDAPESSLG